MSLRAFFGRVALLLPLWAAAPLAGCSGGGDGLPRQPVSGQVTLGGQPLADGTIQFQPDAPSAGAAPGGALIEGGRYRIAREQGLVPGIYKVIISSGGRAAAADEAAPGAQTGPPPERVPAEYNVRTRLTAEVKANQENVFNFDLNKK